MFSGSDIDKLIDLADKNLGKGYLSKTYLEQVITDENSYLLLKKIEDDVLGFSIVQLVESYKITTELFVNDAWVQKHFKPQEKIGLRKTTVVECSYRNRGVATDLIIDGEALIANKASTIVTSIWKHGKEMAILSLLDKLNYSQVDETQFNYWHADSMKNGYSCRICGKPPCKCAAIILKKELGSPQ